MDAIITGCHPEGVLWEVGAALVVAVDVVPSLSLDERELVRCQTHDGAIFLVELSCALGHGSSCKVPDVWKT